jgi:hypothetical protein
MRASCATATGCRPSVISRATKRQGEGCSSLAALPPHFTVLPMRSKNSPAKLSLPGEDSARCTLMLLGNAAVFRANVCLASAMLQTSSKRSLLRTVANMSMSCSQRVKLCVCVTREKGGKKTQCADSNRFQQSKTGKMSRTLSKERATVKLGTIQRRLAWPLRKDDTHNSVRLYPTFFFCQALTHSLKDDEQ